jgi:GNAT superfamily N-acetyltransferase
MIYSVESIRALRLEVRLAGERLDGRCGAVSEALERTLGLARQWGHLRLLDGTVCWLHCWNRSADGYLVDATADQFEALFPGDVLVLAPDDPLAGRYLATPPPRTFGLHVAAGELRVEVDGVPAGVWSDEPDGWIQLADVVLEAMSPWPQPDPVRAFVADHLRRRGPGDFIKRDLEGPIDLWAWEGREARRGRPWEPGDIEIDAVGGLRRRVDPVEVRPVASPAELAEAIELAVRTFPDLHERTGRGPDYYPSRHAEEADLQVVALAGSRVVGLALASLSADGVVAGAGEVAVAADYQRRGVGRAMLAELEARAAARGLARLALGADEDVAGFYLSCGWKPRVQATISGPGRRAVLERLRIQELAAHQIETQEADDIIRVWVPVEAYDAALADRLSAIDGCSAFVMFTKTLPPASAPSR